MLDRVVGFKSWRPGSLPCAEFSSRRFNEVNIVIVVKFFCFCSEAELHTNNSGVLSALQTIGLQPTGESKL